MSAEATTGGGNRPTAGDVVSGMAASPVTVRDILAKAEARHHPLDLAAQRAIEGIPTRRIPVSRYKGARP